MAYFSPSDNVQAELVDALKHHFPEFHKSESEIKSEAERFYKTIEYSKNQSTVSAFVTYMQGQKSWTYVFEYRKKSPPNQREFFWYCVRKNGD